MFSMRGEVAKFIVIIVNNYGIVRVWISEIRILINRGSTVSRVDLAI